MTKKRFTLEDTDWSYRIRDNGAVMKIPKIVDLLNEQHEENEELKSSDTITDLETEIMKLKTTIQQLRTDNTKQKKLLNTTMKENEQLQQQNADWETAFDTCKHYKEAYGTEIVKIKQTIKDMIESERTELGKMTLRHLWRQIQ